MHAVGITSSNASPVRKDTVADFNAAWDFVSKWEGGYSDDPRDPGGETFCGISRRNHPDWPGWAEVDKVKRVYGKSAWVPEMWARTGPQVEGLYRSVYWGDLDTLRDQTLATVIFDAAVNCGAGRSGKWLQSTLCAWGHSVTVDGAVGPQTMNALRDFESNRKADLPQFLDCLLSLRVSHYVSLNKPYYTRGWTRRVSALREIAK